MHRSAGRPSQTGQGGEKGTHQTKARFDAIVVMSLVMWLLDALVSPLCLLRQSV